MKPTIDTLLCYIKYPPVPIFIRFHEELEYTDDTKNYNFASKAHAILFCTFLIHFIDFQPRGWCQKRDTPKRQFSAGVLYLNWFTKAPQCFSEKQNDALIMK